MFFKKTRFFFIIIFFLILIISIIIRFFYLQILNHEKLSSLAKRKYEKKDKEITPRGKIYDINSNLLADSIISWDVVITTSIIQYNEIKNISEILNISTKDITSKIKTTTKYLKIKKNIDKEKYDLLKNFKSLYLEPHQARIYPLECAKEIIGLSNENNGLSGIELIYNKYLKGNIVIKDIIRDRKGNVIKIEEKEINEDPSDIYLTIEHDIQTIVESTIKNHFETLMADKIITIVQNIENGFISAAASYPQNLINFQPVEYVYEPGSTIKTMILSAGFEENFISEDDYINCENGTWKVNQKHTITDHEKLKTVTVKEVYAHSSNIGFAKIGLKIGIEKLYPYIRKFGFGTKYTDFFGESKGIIKDFAKYKEIDLITTSYGYGIAITPLQLINAYTAIANKGKLLQPYFVYKIKSEKEEKIISQPQVIRNVITQQTAERVIKMMIDVVEKGTGINARINGYTVAGKTGTANKLDLKTGKYIKGKNVTSFCGFFPASKPKYSILIIVDNSKKFQYGGQTSAPIFRDIAKQIISIRNIKPDRPFDKEIEKIKTYDIVN
ncbi:MAG: penicillin-binding protein 2 [Elusimicrobiales bacterium]|nr:penicillin-binding protein 2 [Elusimicrobiales bacterium]